MIEHTILKGNKNNSRREANSFSFTHLPRGLLGLLGQSRYHGQYYLMEKEDIFHAP